MKIGQYTEDELWNVSIYESVVSCIINEVKEERRFLLFYTHLANGDSRASIIKPWTFTGKYIGMFDISYKYRPTECNWYQSQLIQETVHSITNYR